MHIFILVLFILLCMFVFVSKGKCKWSIDHTSPMNFSFLLNPILLHVVVGFKVS